MLDPNDTIAAIATAEGEGGIAIVRLSGENAFPILKKVFFPASKKAVFSHGQMIYGYVRDDSGREIDEAMAVYFVSPRSYTREDVCEIHTHGGMASRCVLERVIEAGARPAQRGEFTYRAFLNGRVDLSRAEAVMSLIGAGSERAVRSSVRQLKYGASSRIGACREKLMELLTLIDAAVDFPDEIDEEVTSQKVREEAERISGEISACADKRYARILNEGARVVIAGRPNVGKSSLMNALLRFERSIVTDIPGTTRDIINESVSIHGMKLTLTDTAGIRETGDVIEKLGVERAGDSIESADCVVLVLDASSPLTAEDKKLLDKRDGRYIVVLNKTDLECADDNGVDADLEISALNRTGTDELAERIFRKVSFGEDDGRLSTLRHIECAERAKQALDALLSSPEGTYLDLLRSDITDALECLGEITGENISESAIDGIFERFCVGK